MDLDYVVKLAIKGDDDAFTKLINIYKENLYRTAFAYMKNEEHALDIVQETVYKAYISIDKLKEPSYFKTWLIRILINTAINELNKNKKVIHIEYNEEIDKKLHSNLNSDDKLYVLEALDTLEEKHREIIILKYFNDLTLKEISETLDYPLGTVKTYLNKGLNSLRNFIKKDVV